MGLHRVVVSVRRPDVRVVEVRDDPWRAPSPANARASPNPARERRARRSRAHATRRPGGREMGRRTGRGGRTVARGEVWRRIPDCSGSTTNRNRKPSEAQSFILTLRPPADDANHHSLSPRSLEPGHCVSLPPSFSSPPPPPPPPRAAAAGRTRRRLPAGRVPPAEPSRRLRVVTPKHAPEEFAVVHVVHGLRGVLLRTERATSVGAESDQRRRGRGSLFRTRGVDRSRVRRTRARSRKDGRASGMTVRG